MRCCVSTEEASEVETSEHSLEGGLRASAGGEELHFYSGNSMSKTKEVLRAHTDQETFSVEKASVLLGRGGGGSGLVYLAQTIGQGLLVTDANGAGR